MKKKDKTLMIIIGTLGLGALAYYLMKKSAGQPSPQPSPTPQPQPQPQPSGNLTISNYTLSYNKNSQLITAKGTVLYNNQPVSNIDVVGGFCSVYPSSIADTLTDNNGNFSFNIYTATPPGGANCIFAQTSYKGYTATVKATIQIPNSIIPPDHIHPP